ncbi:MAG: RtcB family protein [Sandaracinaceae bacterium]|nr:RtcB family protein [Sandaracinaceae bacterium]
MSTHVEPSHHEIHGGRVPIKAWTNGVPVETEAYEQLRRLALLPFVEPHVAVMPDVHVGIGATVGSVVPTRGAIVPAAVGVDIGCGMMAVRTSLRASDLPDSLAGLRTSIERAVPVGRTNGGGKGDRGAFGSLRGARAEAWAELAPGFARVCEAHPSLARGNTENHLGTLGTGNHFIELCLDESDDVWVMLHSGSRGVGNRIGSFFIALARRDMERLDARLPHQDLAYFREGTQHFDEYVEAVGWAQRFAAENRRLMMAAVIEALRRGGELPQFTAHLTAVECHHNYVAFERHFELDLIVTRKGAVRAGAGELGIIPGSMGARSFIVRGKGNPESLCSCSHGAGRRMSRTAAKRRFTLADHVAATEGVECRKDAGVIDETPGAYKDIDAVMAAQAELVEVVHELRQVVCVKG